ncbi:pentatricopeptide repeat-containing protein At3g58590-like [Triticum urartu]|uniref:Pentatricopeptide repeat-containing protein n=2 Tax=Triticum urartu TaxID=4572 RepID=A0A8R7PV93_TRIUA|nr:pentatricopeptide repeat-containing protein At3g58590-like [Triticum urartu]
MPNPDPPLPPSLFNSLIASRARAGRAADAFSLLARMLAAGVAPTAFTFAPILSSPSVCPRRAAQLHPHILKRGLLHSGPYSGTALLGFFARHGRFGEALDLFGEMPARSVVTWNCLVSSFAQHGHVQDAVFWFRELVRSSDGLSEGSLVAVFPALVSPDPVHGLAIKTAMDSFSAVANSLLNCYCTRGTVCAAEKLFNGLMFRDVVSWNTMITAFARSNFPGRAFELFSAMHRQGVSPDETTFSSVLYAGTSINAQEHGKSVHAKSIKHNLNTTVFVSTSLVDFYNKCVGRRDALKVLKEVPHKSTACWNALLSIKSDGDFPTLFMILRDMLQSGISPNEFTFSSLLKDPSLLDVHQIHSLVIKLGYDGNDYVSSAIISSYVSHGFVSDALAYGVTLDPDSCNVSMNVLAGAYNRAHMYQETKELLLHPKTSDTISWSILITACARNGDYAEAFGHFRQMRILGHHFDNYVAVSLLSICTKVNSLVLGRLVHGVITKTSYGCSDTRTNNMLLDMYAKCGRIEDCLKAFEEMEDRNVISWTAVISGLALNGFSRKALAWFKAMEEAAVKPDKVAILAVLSACRHGGLVQEGMEIFKRMEADYSTEAGMEHYICVVDMLCKCGHLKQADSVIRGMPFRPSTIIWRTFIQGCNTYGMLDTQVFS